MNILGIETSCDETAAAVVRDGRRVLSNVVATSLREHRRHGGIIPEIASRRQLEWIDAVVSSALQKSRTTLSGIDAVAVTKSPGLIGSLLVGLSYARAVSFAASIPLVEVDHVKAHLYANTLSGPDRQSPSEKKLEVMLPAVGLIVSGGHTSLYDIRDFSRFRLLGQTRDDAAGEAFDKVARILGLGYPGGPAIEKAASRSRRRHLRFTCADLPGSLDFSFSGIKTAVLYHHNKHHGQPGYDISEVAYAFQESVVNVLVDKCLAACRSQKVLTLLVGGGVAANTVLRQRLTMAASREGLNLFYPELSLCQDNAAMIAGLGFHAKKS